MSQYAISLVVLLHVEFYSSYVGNEENREQVFKELGARLKALRKGRGHSQEDMLSFGFSTRHWQQVEAGRPITLKTLLRICDVFEVKPETLLAGIYKVERGSLPTDSRKV